MCNRISLEFQVPSNKVSQDKTAPFPDVHSVVNSGSGRIDGYLARLERHEGLFGMSQGIVKSKVGLLLYCKERCAQIALSTIRENHYHHTLGQRFDFFLGDGHGGAGTHTPKDAFFPSQASCHLKGGLIINVDLLVQAFLFINLGPV